MARKHILLVSFLLIVISTNVKAKEGASNAWEIVEVDEAQKATSDPQTTIQPQYEPTASPLTSEDDAEYKVVCYLGNSEWDPNKINVDLCSHIVYIYVATLGSDNLLIMPREISPEFKERVSILKSKGIKVMVAVGGWDDSVGTKYTRLVGNDSRRAEFVADAVNFLERSGFDGIELQWQYPKCWQGACVGPDTDRTGFTELIKEMHDAFKPKGLLLSAYVSPLKYEIDRGYDVPTISQYLDWLAVMCHSYHGYWNGITGHVAPMYAQPHDYVATANTNFSINYWIEKGADRKKLLVTMPAFGRTYSLYNNDNHGLGVPSNGAGEGKGAIPYSKVCQNVIDKGWTMVRDEKYKVGPYAYSGRQWVSFDDTLMVEYKSKYIKHMGLGGAMVWSLDFDDSDNVCKCESYPLLKAINRVLRNYNEPDPRCYLDFDNSVVVN